MYWGKIQTTEFNKIWISALCFYKRFFVEKYQNHRQQSSSTWFPIIFTFKTIAHVNIHEEPLDKSSVQLNTKYSLFTFIAYGCEMLKFSRQFKIISLMNDEFPCALRARACVCLTVQVVRHTSENTKIYFGLFFPPPTCSFSFLKFSL